jgi:hypothetical protein
MSAWIPSKSHIDLLVKVAILDGHAVDTTPDELGQTLVDEVVKSVSYRYPDDDVEMGELPGPVDAYYLKPYAYEAPLREFTDREITAAVDCFNYQACEHPGWNASDAAGLTAAIAAGHRYTEGLSPHDEPRVPWGFEREDVHTPIGKAA